MLPPQKGYIEKSLQHKCGPNILSTRFLKKVDVKGNGGRKAVKRWKAAGWRLSSVLHQPSCSPHCFKRYKSQHGIHRSKAAGSKTITGHSSRQLRIYRTSPEAAKPSGIFPNTEKWKMQMHSWQRETSWGANSFQDTHVRAHTHAQACANTVTRKHMRAQSCPRTLTLTLTFRGHMSSVPGQQRDMEKPNEFITYD